jgi:hypothetical protein
VPRGGMVGRSLVEMCDLALATRSNVSSMLLSCVPPLLTVVALACFSLSWHGVRTSSRGVETIYSRQVWTATANAPAVDAEERARPPYRSLYRPLIANAPFPARPPSPARRAGPRAPPPGGSRAPPGTVQSLPPRKTVR